MADIGTYGSSIAPFFPYKILPEESDIITWDWMDSIGQFQQRYLKIATSIATIADTDEAIFNYSALRCDFFPPYLKFYVYEPLISAFEIYNPFTDTSAGVPEAEAIRLIIYGVGLGTCKVVNNLNRPRSFLMVAYL